ncbi:hypothetical protein ACFCX4_10975 [Kitasatospora sp. NPDC056327]|uniref:hypothetical protein n=1 Tax=Kitasatospora sp. NPDC056327 TaxID=3345785 RepID=UPI0035D7AFEA
MTEPRRSAARRQAGRWWPIVLAVPLGAAAGAGYAVVADPSYAANSYVVVVPEEQTEPVTAVNFAQAYGRLAGRPQVLAAAAAESGHSRAELESLVSGTTSPDAPVIEITGTGSDPQEAVRAADAVARSLVAFGNGSTKETGVRLVPLAGAAEPDRPTTPSGRLDVAVGAAAGVLIGALVLMTRRRNAGDAGPVGDAGPADGQVPAEPGAATAPRPRAAEPEPVGDGPGKAVPGKTGRAKAAPGKAGRAKAGPEQAGPAGAAPAGESGAAGPEPAAAEPAGAGAAAGGGR